MLGFMLKINSYRVHIATRKVISELHEAKIAILATCSYWGKHRDFELAGGRGA